MTAHTDDHQTGASSSVWWRTRWLDAMAAAKVKPMPRLVAYAYADFARQKRMAYASSKILAERTGMSTRQAIRSRAQLVDDGWLIEVVAATKTTAATYALVIPEGVGTDSESVPPLTDSQGGSDCESVPPCQTVSTGTDTQSDKQSPNQSLINLSPNQRALQKALGCDERDERLMIADSLFATHNVRSAPAWLRTARSNGDLDGLIQAELDAKANPWGRSTIRDWSKTDSNGDEVWMQADSSLTHDQQRKKWEARVAALTQQPEPCTNPDCKAGWIDVGEKVAHCPDCRPNRKKTA